MNRAKAHQILVEEIMLDLQKHFKTDILLFKRTTGKFHLKRGGIVSIGVVGQADIFGFLAMYRNRPALAFELEVKTGSAVQTKEQKLWEKSCKKIGVFYSVVREDESSKIIKEFEHRRQAK